MAKILLVDDDDEARDLLQRALEVEGYAVDVAQTGAAALGALDTETPPDLILADLMMPDIDGWEFLRLLGAGRWKRIPVVLVTGWFGEFPPGYEVVKKPFQLAEVLATVARHLGGARPEREA
jgi:DNA-binding response OmpR family regulator